MKRINILLVLITTLFASCNNAGTQTQRKKNEVFEEFYQAFYTDTLFQKNRITFPLPGYNSDYDLELPDDVAEQMGVSKDKDFYWEKDEWNFINTVNKDDNTVIKTIEKSDTLVIEKLMMPNTGFEITRKFKPIEGKWYLIYYFYQNI